MNIILDTIVRSNMDTIFDVLIRKMVNYKGISTKSMTNECD